MYTPPAPCYSYHLDICHRVQVLVMCCNMADYNHRFVQVTNSLGGGALYSPHISLTISLILPPEPQMGTILAYLTTLFLIIGELPSCVHNPDQTPRTTREIPPIEPIIYTYIHMFVF